jgi:GH25 family lysozyme M1 (1,4-beta-N-acetylmuramidase)
MDRLENYDLWIADYRSTRPTITHGMWQYTSKATVDGISGNVDMSHAYKDYPAIIKNAGLNGIK